MLLPTDPWLEIFGKEGEGENTHKDREFQEKMKKGGSAMKKQEKMSDPRMFPVGAVYFYQAHAGCTVLSKWQVGRIPFSLYLTLFQIGRHASAKRVSHKPCFHKARCFMQKPLRFLVVPPNPTCAHSHFWGVTQNGPGHTPLYGREFPEEIPEKFRKDPGNAPQTLQFKAFEASRTFPEFSPPQHGWGRLFFQKCFRRGPPRTVVMEFPVVLRVCLKKASVGEGERKCRELGLSFFVSG